jgi:hypothetical protein
MPIRTAQKNRLKFGFINCVGGIIAPAAHQANILDALDALTYPEFCRSHVHIHIHSLVRPDGVRAFTNRISSRGEIPRLRSMRRAECASVVLVAKRRAACYHRPKVS